MMKSVFLASNYEKTPRLSDLVPTGFRWIPKAVMAASGDDDLVKRR